MLLHQPTRAAARDQLGVVVVARGEQDRQFGPGSRQQVAQLEAVVVAQAYVEENGLWGVPPECVQRGGGGACVGDDVVTACGEEHSGAEPERRVVVDDYDSWKAVVRGLWER